jgi:hypothetical protein
MSWATISVGDLSKGNTNKVVKTNEYVLLPFPCSDSADCTYYSVTLGPGAYHLEVWGAQGGNDTSYPDTVFGGRGGYSKGTVQLNSKTTLYVYVGGSGTGYLPGSNWGSTGGGGGTDIRLQNGAWNSSTGLKTRIIVAGGGGGRHGENYEKVTGFIGNDGGGTTAPSFTVNSRTITGSTQTSGGSSTASDSIVGSFGYANQYGVRNVNSRGGYNGGANGSDNYANGGGGGGWWGGCTSWTTSSGGSGFVYTSSNSQCSASADYYLSNASTFSGNTNFISPYGGSRTGHIGNGFARITALNIVPAPTPSASANLRSLCNQYYSNNANQRKNMYFSLMSLFIFSLLEDGISFSLLPITKLG